MSAGAGGANAAVNAAAGGAGAGGNGLRLNGTAGANGTAAAARTNRIEAVRAISDNLVAAYTAVEDLPISNENKSTIVAGITGDVDQYKAAITLLNASGYEAAGNLAIAMYTYLPNKSVIYHITFDLDQVIGYASEFDKKMALAERLLGYIKPEAVNSLRIGDTAGLTALIAPIGLDEDVKTQLLAYVTPLLNKIRTDLIDAARAATAAAAGGAGGAGAGAQTSAQRVSEYLRMLGPIPEIVSLKRVIDTTPIVNEEFSNSLHVVITSENPAINDITKTGVLNVVVPNLPKLYAYYVETKKFAGTTEQKKEILKNLVSSVVKSIFVRNRINNTIDNIQPATTINFTGFTDSDIITIINRMFTTIKNELFPGGPGTGTGSGAAGGAGGPGTGSGAAGGGRTGSGTGPGSGATPNPQPAPPTPNPATRCIATGLTNGKFDTSANFVTYLTCVMKLSSAPDFERMTPEAYGSFLMDIPRTNKITDTNTKTILSENLRRLYLHKYINRRTQFIVTAKGIDMTLYEALIDELTDYNDIARNNLKANATNAAVTIDSLVTLPPPSMPPVATDPTTTATPAVQQALKDLLTAMRAKTSCAPTKAQLDAVEAAGKAIAKMYSAMKAAAGTPVSGKQFGGARKSRRRVGYRGRKTRRFR